MFELPKLLITRFLPGSGGKFLSSVLQSSASVSHWDDNIEQIKSTKLFNELILNYIDKSFSTEYKYHVQREPMSPYSTDLFSSTYNRGYNIDIQQLTEHAFKVSDKLFIKALKNEKYINLIMHKPSLPAFCSNSCVVTITVESKKELHWLYQTIWNKHFLQTDTNILYLPDHPHYCNPKSLPKILEYNNQYQFDISEKNLLINEKIINHRFNQFFNDKRSFSKLDSSQNINNMFIPLSSFFDKDQFNTHIQSIFDHFNFENFNAELVENIRTRWVNSQISYCNDNVIYCKSDLLNFANLPAS